MADLKPQLPLGNTSILRGISENFSFHASPEAFITSRILELQRSNPDALKSRAPVRAKVLNRNVAIISSYAQIVHVLGTDGRDNGNDSPPYVAAAAYQDLMAPFFPTPNLLLTDGVEHEELRKRWEERMSTLTDKLRPLVAQTAREHFLASASESVEVDLYESLKALSWKIILGAFLDLKPSDPDFAQVQDSHEVLLRGQFSLFPISVNAGIWASPRKKGIDAKKQLKAKLAERLRQSPQTCPFQTTEDGKIEDAANHAVLFTSSLAVKGLASLLTAYFLNVFLFPTDNPSAAGKPAASDDAQISLAGLKNVLLETERLSPPIVGIMRRSTRENVIPSEDGKPDLLIPKGWDVWLYIVGAGRDPSVFGDSWDQFLPRRYDADSTTAAGLAFSARSKNCLGQELIRDIALTCARTCIEAGVHISGEVTQKGVRGWLGWERDGVVSPNDWASDMKQLPTQRPAKPLLVRISM